LLSENFTSELVGSIREIKNFKDGNGAVFDVAQEFEGEILSFIEKDPEVEFHLKKTESLPELEEGFSRNYNERSSLSNSRRGGNSEGYKSNSTSSFKPDEDVQVFVGSLVDSVREDDLEGFFQKEGLRPRRIKLLKDEDGNSRGSAFITFGRKEDVERAIELSGNRLMSRNIKISPVNSRR